MTEVPSGGAKDELDRARHALRAAEILAREGEYADAVSRSYYAVFHAACALLASIGRSARTHEGVRRLLGEHFVRPGLLDVRFARALAHTGAERNEADYDAAAVFGDEDAARNVKVAGEFIEAVAVLVGVRPAG